MRDYSVAPGRRAADIIDWPDRHEFARELAAGISGPSTRTGLDLVLRQPVLQAEPELSPRTRHWRRWTPTS